MTLSDCATVALVIAAVVVPASIGYVRAIDRSDRLARAALVPVRLELPRVVAIPTAWRRK